MEEEIGNFDYGNFLELEFERRFPQWCRGYGLWGEFVGEPDYEKFNKLRNLGISEKINSPLFMSPSFYFPPAKRYGFCQEDSLFS
ncbi:hypothetical protein M3O96_00040 [Aquiflexum sp. TKW24L]|uniref:hypothetical protein n=1 Tax=Aquiflexum sp. TKW24L TaxID=2942212 RepID=UPI0020BF63D2|nr:hypothetical protein [Aquiflexum sp. TKW24L]MCL6257458.1 hypothetical protein [Aquiflexum sp. TKW24L]